MNATLPPGWTCTGPATFEHLEEGWIVSVDDTTGETLIGRLDDERPHVTIEAPALAMRRLTTMAREAPAA